MPTPEELAIAKGPATKDDELKLVILRAADLPPTESDGMTDPYVKIILSGGHAPGGKVAKHEPKKTNWKKRTLDPEWNESFSFEGVATEHAEVLLVVKDWNPINLCVLGQERYRSCSR